MIWEGPGLAQREGASRQERVLWVGKEEVRPERRRVELGDLDFAPNVMKRQETPRNGPCPLL